MRLPDVSETGRRGATCVAGRSGEPGLRVELRPGDGGGIDNLVVHGPAEACGVAAGVEHDGRAGIIRIAVHAQKLSALPIEIIRAVGGCAGGGWILGDALHKDKWESPSLVRGLTQNQI